VDRVQPEAVHAKPGEIVQPADQAAEVADPVTVGGTVTLTLQQQGPGEVVGTLEGNGASFEVDAEVRADGIVGMVSSDEAMVHLTGRITGPTLFIVLIEPGPGGQPDLQSRRVIRFSKPGGQAP